MQNLKIKKRDIVDFFLKKGMLISSDLLQNLENENLFLEVTKLIDNKESRGITVLNNKIKELLNNPTTQKLNWSELEKIEVISEKKGDYEYNEIFEPILTQPTHSEKEEP